MQLQSFTWSYILQHLNFFMNSWYVKKLIIKILIVISWKFMTKTAISFIAFDGGWSHYVLHCYCSIQCCIQKSCQWRGGKTGICQKLMGGVKPPSMCVGTWPIKGVWGMLPWEKFRLSEIISGAFSDKYKMGTRHDKSLQHPPT